MFKIKILKIFCTAIVFSIVSFLKLSFLCGTHSMFFSAFCIVGPISGGWLGIEEIFIAFVLSKFIFCTFTGVVPFLSTGVPTIAAAYCWRFYKNSDFDNSGLKRFGINVILPLLCMILFVLHPSVGNGWIYSLYWLIPIVVYIVQESDLLQINSFLISVSSTFIAHCVGSVIWCYMMPMNSSAWLSLIPVVAVERLVFACAMTCVYILIQKSKSFNFLSYKKIGSIFVLQ